MRAPALLVAFCAVFFLGLAEFVSAADIRGVRLWRAPDNTRLVFDLSGPIQHNLFTLTAPERIVIDVNGAKLTAALDKLPLANTPITSVRSAQRTPQDVRLVIDLSTSVNAKSFVLAPNQEYGHRLVVDLFDKEPAAVAKPATTVPTAPAVQQQKPKVATSAPVVPLPRQTTGQRDVIIAIDAGHGGEDPGAIGPGGIHEKKVVLEISKELQRLINNERGYRAELVRTGDYFIPLRKRTEIARKKNADLFVSVHADAAPRKTAFGASVYALSSGGATSETARWLADAENRSDLIGGAGTVLDSNDKMLAGVLLDLSMTATLASSLNVGQKVLTNMGRVAPLHKRRVEQAGFMVLKSPDIPSILVETGFISNPDEAKKLQTKSHQQALARSIQTGIKQFFEENPPPGTYVAHLRDSGRIQMGPREHIVARGDSLAVISQRYQVSIASIRSANQMQNDVVKIGQVLKIPAASVAVQQ